MLELFYEGGIPAFVRYLDRTKQGLIKEPIYITGEKDGHHASNAPCGGMTAIMKAYSALPTTFRSAMAARIWRAFAAALTRIINTYAAESGIAKKEKVAITGDDAREGLTCVLSVKVPDPKFSSQTKDKLVSSEVRPVVEGLCQRTAWRLV